MIAVPQTLPRSDAGRDGKADRQRQGHDPDSNASAKIAGKRLP